MPFDPMNLTSPSQVRSFLNSMGIRPSKALGQNFLIDRNILGILLGAADIVPDDSVLEVGPGLGVVTEGLLGLSHRVVAVEKDGRLLQHLKARFAGAANLELLHGDMLELGAAGLLGSGLNKVVSNLPYSVGTRILVDCLQAAHAPVRMVVTVQREVAERLAAGPGSRTYGLLSVWAQADYEIDIVKTVSATCFWPRPEVSSAIVRLRHRPATELPEAVRSAFYALTKRAFVSRRKQMGAIVSTEPLKLAGNREEGRCLLEELAIDPRARPENLSAADWIRLARGYAG